MLVVHIEVENCAKKVFRTAEDMIRLDYGDNDDVIDGDFVEISGTLSTVSEKGPVSHVKVKRIIPSQQIKQSNQCND